MELKKLEEQIEHLKIDVEYGKTNPLISEGRWNQMKGRLKTQASRRLGFPSIY